MSTTFINKYKPYFIDEFTINKDLLNIIKTLMTIDDINFLFIGPSNSGKTTMLECILRSYYNLSKTQSFNYNNIMIINNLKEQGVNYYRNEMKTFCQSKSSIYGKKKFVVVDDIDTISEQSQQVFRNYIDKYKNNVNFICVCSNIQKIIESIQSRLYIFKLYPLTIQDNKNIMNHIISNENMKVNSYIRNYLINISDNNIRHIIHNLEKIHIFNDYKISISQCRELCSNISMEPFENFISLIKNQDIYQAIHILYKYHDYGYSVIDILEFFFFFIKNTTLLTEIQKYKIIPVICEYITIFNKLQEDIIELSLFTNDIYQIICS